MFHRYVLLAPWFLIQILRIKAAGFLASSEDQIRNATDSAVGVNENETPTNGV
jgi:hypothetical protein